jgi:ABC-type transport system substrate-binding protein
LKNYVHGSLIELERNPNYWKKGFPYPSHSPHQFPVS